MSTKKVIYLPASTALPLGARLLTEEEAAQRANDKAEWTEVVVPKNPGVESDNFIMTITKFGDTEFVSLGLDFGLDNDKPPKTKRTDAEIQDLINLLSKPYKRKDK